MRQPASRDRGEEEWVIFRTCIWTVPYVSVAVAILVIQWAIQGFARTARMRRIGMSNLLDGLNENQLRAVTSTAPVILCECGCGQPTKMFTENDAKRGRVKGKYARYIKGHNLRRGNNHGFSVANGGYVEIRSKNGRKRHHRHVMEQALGRKLKPNEVVHHIDHDRTNNEPENLMIFQSHAEHNDYHKAELRSNLPEGHKKCPRCGIVKSLDGFYKHNRRGYGVSSHCKDCRSKYEQERWVKRKHAKAT